MPWLTPDSIPEEDDCRPLFIPADSVWLALVSGALTELTQPYNWEQYGALTVQETVDKMAEIINGYYDTACLNCTFPDGGHVIRIGEAGQLQELDDNGEWVEPSGDYLIPPPDARTGGSPTDQICQASANAVNVLHQLYTSLSDSWNSELDDAEAATAFTLTLIGLVGFEFAPITAGIVIFMAVVFSTLYHALEYLGADLWTEEVENQIICFLVACATNTDGVVTFDWDCFLAKLNSLTDDFLLDEVQLRLYLQISYILYFIGGVNGLNLAGGTTEITDANCDLCEPHCFEIDLLVSNGSGLGVHITGGTWGSGTGIQGADFGTNNKSDAYGYWDFGEEVQVTSLQFEYTKPAGSGANNQNFVHALNPATAYNATIITSDFTNSLGTHQVKGFDVNDACSGVGWDLNSGTATNPVYVEKLRVYYTGFIPSGWSDNCP